MIVRTMNDVKELKNIVDECAGDVWLESTEGSRYDLKDELSQFIGFAALLQDKEDQLMLFATHACDQLKLMGYLGSHAA